MRASSPFVYQLNAIGAAVGRGSTRPIRVQIAAIAKADTTDLPATVFCEMATLQLARLMGAPVVGGMLVTSASGLIYVSPALERSSLKFLVTSTEHCRRIVRWDPDGAARVLVLDTLVGNLDRLGNAYAIRRGETTRCVGFDHARTLVQCRGSLEASFSALSDHSIIRHHPFRLVSHQALEIAVDAAMKLTPTEVHEACDLGGLFPLHSACWGARLEDVLLRRRAKLPEMLL